MALFMLFLVSSSFFRKGKPVSKTMEWLLVNSLEMESYFAEILSTSKSVVCVSRSSFFADDFVTSNFGALFSPPGFATSIAS